MPGTFGIHLSCRGLVARDGGASRSVSNRQILSLSGPISSAGRLGLAGEMKMVRLCVWLCALPVLTAAPVWAAEGGKGPSDAIFIAQIITLMVVGRLLGEAMLRLRQPAVMGQLIAGLLLGPSFFGFLFPDLQHALFPKNAEQKAMIDAI